MYSTKAMLTFQLNVEAVLRYPILQQWHQRLLETKLCPVEFALCRVSAELYDLSDINWNAIDKPVSHFMVVLIGLPLSKVGSGSFKRTWNSIGICRTRYISRLHGRKYVEIWYIFIVLVCFYRCTLRRIQDICVKTTYRHLAERLINMMASSNGDMGAVSIRKTVLPGMAIPMLQIRRPNGRLIFNMEIAIRR